MTVQSPDTVLDSTDFPVSLFVRTPGQVASNSEPVIGRLKEIDSRFLRIVVPEAAHLPAGTVLGVEFTIDRFRFEMETTVSRVGDGGELLLDKPREIHRRRLRGGVRADTNTPINFTLWTEVGRYQADLLDISVEGIRMLAYRPLRRWDLISMDFFLREPGLRIQSQGTVIWSRSAEEGQNMYETGVQFNSLAEDVRTQLAHYAEQRGLAAGEQR